DKMLTWVTDSSGHLVRPLDVLSVHLYDTVANVKDPTNGWVPLLNQRLVNPVCDQATPPHCVNAYWATEFGFACVQRPKYSCVPDSFSCPSGTTTTTIPPTCTMQRACGCSIDMLSQTQTSDPGAAINDEFDACLVRPSRCMKAFVWNLRRNNECDSDYGLVD